MPAPSRIWWTVLWSSSGPKVWLSLPKSFSPAAANTSAAGAVTVTSPARRMRFAAPAARASVRTDSASAAERKPSRRTTVHRPTKGSSPSWSRVFLPLTKWKGASTWVPLWAHMEKAVRLLASPLSMLRMRSMAGAGSPGYTLQEKSSWVMS